MTVEIFKATTSGVLTRKDNATYSTAHSAANADSITGSGNTRAMNSWGWLASNYTILRGFIFFDTSGLPDGVNITAARIYFSRVSTGEDDTGQATLHIVEGVQSDPVVVSDYGAHLTKTTSGGSITRAAIVAAGALFFLSLNATGLGWISKTGTTKFCLRLAGDIDNSTPAGKNDVNLAYFSETAPRGTTDAASGVGIGSATLNGTFGGLHPICIEVTYDGADAVYPKARFQYGLNISYGTNTVWQEALQHGDAIEQAISGLAASTTYHYRIQTENASGNKTGSDTTFGTTAGTSYPTDAITRVTGITKIHDRNRRPTIYRTVLQLGGLANLPNLEDAFNNIVSDPSARDRYFREPWLDPREKTLPKVQPDYSLPEPVPLRPGLPVPEPAPLPSPAPPTPVPPGRPGPGGPRPGPTPGRPGGGTPPGGRKWPGLPSGGRGGFL